VKRLPGPDSSFSYNALSYHWESAGKNCNILCNDCFTEVSPTLYEALKQYRYSGQGKPLWVDALCIDQGYLPERNHQVQLMPEIYERADLVIA
jgi:hypothetical protein